MDNSWGSFVSEKLLSQDLVDGLCLITHQGHVAYVYGILDCLDQENWKQFLHIFKYSTEKHDQAVYNQGFTLMKNRKPIRYNVYQKTYNSVYTNSDNHTGGLLACNLPHGILLCTYGQSKPPGKVVKAVEDFCAILRR